MRLLAPFLLIFALVGCRDPLVDPIEEPGTEPPPSYEVANLYVKGPTDVKVGDETGFRAESVAEAASYDWRVEVGSTGLLLGTVTADASGHLRQFKATAVEAGTVVLLVTASDADGRPLATGKKTVRIGRF